MAIYHCRFKVHSRGTGAVAGQAAAYRSGTQVHGRKTSAVRAAAYRAGSELVDVAGEIHDFRRKQAVMWNGILAPEGVPDWVYNRSALWNHVEEREDRSNRKDTAQLFREAELSIPRELSPQQRIALVRAFVQDQFVAKGMVADIGIHCPKASDGGQQPHAHVMLTMREIGPDGFGKKRRDWNDVTKAEKAAGLKSPLMQWREAWQTYCNAALEEAGSKARIDHRSLADQGKTYDPIPEQGAAIYVKEHRGEYADRREALLLAEFKKRAHEMARALGRKTAPSPARASAAVSVDTFDHQADRMRKAAGRLERQGGYRDARNGIDHAIETARRLQGEKLERSPEARELWGDHDR